MEHIRNTRLSSVRGPSRKKLVPTHFFSTFIPFSTMGTYHIRQTSVLLHGKSFLDDTRCCIIAYRTSYIVTLYVQIRSISYLARPAQSTLPGLATFSATLLKRQQKTFTHPEKTAIKQQANCGKGRQLCAESTGACCPSCIISSTCSNSRRRSEGMGLKRGRTRAHGWKENE